MDFGLGLVIGMIIGLLINWVVEPLFKRQTPVITAENEDRQALEPVPATPEKITKVILRDRDNFEQINGIGPVFASRLNEAGIFTFKQLAGTSASRLSQLVASEAWQNIDAQAWIEEARQLDEQRQDQ